MSAEERLTPSQISQRLRCSDQCVRDALHAFEAEGLTCLQEKSRARHDDQSALDAAGRARLKELVRLSPRAFGYETSLWTLGLLAQLCYERGWTGRRLSPETISRTLGREGISWRRAKHWIHSPDPHYEVKKSVGIG